MAVRKLSVQFARDGFRAYGREAAFARCVTLCGPSTNPNSGSRIMKKRRINNICRARGIAGSAIDLLICAAAHLRNREVFTTDRDFIRYSEVLPLRLHGISKIKIILVLFQ
jgi:hypothetical protein